MKRMALVFGWGLGISCLGSLPPGVLNSGVAELVVERGVSAAAGFGLGAVLVEMGLVRLALAGMSVFRRGRWAGIGFGGVLLLLAGAQVVWGGARISAVARWPWLAGAALSLLNPLHLPFWLGWTAVLRAKKALGATTVEYNLFALAAGMGTVLAFGVYAVAGRLFVLWWRENQEWFNAAIALVLLLSGLRQLRQFRANLSNGREG